MYARIECLLICRVKGVPFPAVETIRTHLQPVADVEPG